MMSLFYILAAIITGGLFVYRLVALLNPELFP